MEEEYIVIYQATGGALPFVSLRREIEFILQLQQDTPKVLFSILKKVMVHEDNQRSDEIVVALQIQYHNKHTAINYYHFRSFATKCDV